MTTPQVLMLSAAVFCACACAESNVEEPRAGRLMTEDLVFLTRDGCANTLAMRTNLDAALSSMGYSAEYAVVDLGMAPQDDARAGFGTPTLLYQNRDLFGMPTPSGRNPEAT